MKKGNSLDTKDAHLAAMNLGNAHNRRLKYSFDKTAEDEKKEKEDDKHHHVEHLHENPEGHHPERKKSLDNKNYPIATDVVQVPVLGKKSFALKPLSSFNFSYSILFRACATSKYCPATKRCDY